ncbi:hypothetical protein KAU33_13375 [Candidatus Dependentiae bacterium]|nr:hypothetical protein [Candidatus Dependentiae bacterium]
MLFFLVLSWAFFFIGIYIRFSKDPFAKKNLWKTGMWAGIIFITISVIIPFKVVITLYDSIPLPSFPSVMFVHLLFAIMLECFLGGPGSLVPFGTLYIRFSITLLLLYGGLGAFIGYVIGKFIPSEKKNNLRD